MHDLHELDRRGIPGVMIATEAFHDAAEAQMDQLGFQCPVVWIPHPVQNRTDEELRTLAESVFDKVVGALTTS